MEPMHNGMGHKAMSLDPRLEGEGELVEEPY